MSKMLAAVLLAIAAAGSGGCATTSQFAALSNKSLNLSAVSVDPAKIRAPVSGEDCIRKLLFFGGGSASMGGAVENALNGTGSDVLVNARVNFHWFFFPFIYSERCWSVTGGAYDSYP